MEALLKHPAYVSGLSALGARGLSVRPLEDFDNRMAQEMQECAQIPPEELLCTLEGHSPQLLRYTQLKLDLLKGAEEEEFNPAEEDLNPEAPVTLKSGAYSYSCLCTHLVEFHFLRSAPLELEAYLKRYRIPGAKKYAAQLRKFYKGSL